MPPKEEVKPTSAAQEHDGRTAQEIANQLAAERLYLQNDHYLEHIIHRSENMIIVAQPEAKKFYGDVSLIYVFTILQSKKNQHRGWKAPKDEPYVPIGDPENVLPVVEQVKYQIEHSLEMSAETQRLINKIKRSHNPLFQGEKPRRTWKILNQNMPQEEQEESKRNPQAKLKKKTKQKFNLANERIDLVALSEGDPSSIMSRMKAIQDAYMVNPQLYDPALQRKKDTKNEDDE